MNRTLMTGEVVNLADIIAYAKPNQVFKAHYAEENWYIKKMPLIQDENHLEYESYCLFNYCDEDGFSDSQRVCLSHSDISAKYEVLGFKKSERQLKCIKSVVVNESAGEDFKQGKIYPLLKNGVYIESMSEFQKKHGLSDSRGERDDWFQEHFEIVVIGDGRE
ncbi:MULTISPECIES: hypothetical protein [unclassified Bacillus (in: firmicutes)]|uniref:hypothetical protein n=2 Tax=Bacillus TaxID=1386 RepID=UPI00300FB84A